MLYAPIDGFENYLACSDGFIINADGNILQGTVKKTGYIEVILRDMEKAPHYKLLHRIIAQCFCEKPNGCTEVNHKDGDKRNNKAVNLEWVTHGDNLKHAYVTGLRKDDVSPKKVRATNIETGESAAFSSIYSAARFLGVSQGNICMCCKGLRPYASGYYWEYDE